MNSASITYASYEHTNVPTAKEIRERWCFGLPLINANNGDPMDDKDIEGYILGAINRMEQELGVFMKPTRIVSNSPMRNLPRETYDIEEPPYDYSAKQYRQWGFLQLRHRPVLELTSFKLVLPNGQIIADFMARPEWIKLYKDSGQVHIVPYAGDPTLFYLLGGSQSGFPFVTGKINQSLPQMFYVDYTAGYAEGAIPAFTRDIIAKIATVEVLGVAGDAILAGYASGSTSIDGLSESYSTTASATSATYGAHILQYQKEIEEFFAKGKARSMARGITMTVL
jgi:hypothetical protein